GDRKAHAVDGAHAAEALAQVADLEDAHRGLRARTSTRMITPTAARQYSTFRAATSCSQVKSAAPHTGPASVWMPPSSPMTSPSTERGMPSISGEIEPLEKA